MFMASFLSIRSWHHWRSLLQHQYISHLLDIQDLFAPWAPLREIWLMAIKLLAEMRSCQQTVTELLISPQAVGHIYQDVSYEQPASLEELKFLLYSCQETFSHAKKTHCDAHTNRPHFTEAQKGGGQRGPLQTPCSKQGWDRTCGASAGSARCLNVGAARSSAPPRRTSARSLATPQCSSSTGLHICRSPTQGISGKRAPNIHGDGEWERIIKNSQWEPFQWTGRCPVGWP